MKILLALLSPALLFLLSCAKPEVAQPIIPTPSGPKAVVIAEELPEGGLFEFGHIYHDYFADLPVSLPQSAGYRVARIDVFYRNNTSPFIKVDYEYDPTGQLMIRTFRSQVPTLRSWVQRFTRDDENRITREVNADGNYLDYSYAKDRPVQIVTKNYKSLYGAPYLTTGLVTMNQYAENRQVGATILNYYHPLAVGNIDHPVDSTRRQFIYSTDGRTITEKDSLWAVFSPNTTPFRAFRSVKSSQRTVDENGFLLSLTSEDTRFLTFYPGGTVNFQYAYDGPDGLINTRTNLTAGVTYRFIYEKK